MIHLVHGFNVRDRGANSIGRLVPYLQERGLKSDVLSYPWTRLVTLSTNSRWAVQELCDQVMPGDGAIGHSNGCSIIVQAAALGAPLDWIMLVNPALDADQEFAPQLRKIAVFYSKGDLAVRAGAAWRVITRVLPWRWFNRHPWGAMGAHGYRGEDPRVTNIEMPESFGHSGVWQHHQWRAILAASAARFEREAMFSPSTKAG